MRYHDIIINVQFRTHLAKFSWFDYATLLQALQALNWLGEGHKGLACQVRPKHGIVDYEWSWLKPF